MFKWFWTIFSLGAPESREQFYFVQKNLQNVARFTGPRQTCISASDQTSLYGVIPQKL